MNCGNINSKEKNIENLRTKIEVLYDIDKLELLIEEGKKLLGIDPNDDYALYMMGLAYKHLGKLEEAEDVALSYLRLYPNDADAHSLYGEVLNSKDEYEQAIFEYSKAIELSPIRSYFHYKLAINLFMYDNKNLDQSIKQVLHALELEPDNAIYHSYLSEQYINAGKLNDAKNEASKALELGANIAIVRGQYGKVQMYFENFNEAEEHIMESLRLNPMDEISHKYLDLVKEYKKDIRIYFRYIIEYYNELGNFDEAENIALRYIREYYNDAKAHQLYGKILYNKNRFEQAIKEFYISIDLDDGDEFSYFVLAATLQNVNKNNVSLSIDLLLKALEISPNNANFHAFLGYLYLKIYNFESAKKEYLKALELDPKNAFVQSHWGQFQLFSGNINDAQRYIDEALKLNQNEEVAKNILKNIEQYKGNVSAYLKQVIKFHLHCLKKHPQGEEGHLILSKIFIQKGNIKKAIYEFKKYIRLRPDDIEECINFSKLMCKEIGERKTFVYFKKLHDEYPNNEAIGNYIEKTNDKLNLQEIDFKKEKKLCMIGAIVVIVALIIRFL